MTDEDVGEVEVALQLVEQVEHLRLHAHIQGRYALIADDELGAKCQCTGYADPLPLPTAELVRIAVEMLGQQIHPFQQLHHLGLALGIVRIELVHLHGLHDGIAHGDTRVER